MTVHLFAAKAQPAHDYLVTLDDGPPFRCETNPRATTWCHKCLRRRRFANLVVHVYYDAHHFYCAEPCKRPSRREMRERRRAERERKGGAK